MTYPTDIASYTTRTDITDIITAAIVNAIQNDLMGVMNALGINLASILIAGSNAGKTTTNLGTVTTADINGGTIDGATIGGATPAAATVTTLSVNTSVGTSLISDTDATDSLGSTGVKWLQVFTNRLTLEEGGATTTPASGDVALYAKANGLLYSKDDAGTETLVSGGESKFQLDNVGLADAAYTGIWRNGTAGATLAVGDLCYFAVADSRWELVDASAAATAFGMLGICVLAAANDGSATKMLLFGSIRADAAFPTFTVGAPVFISETPGDVTNTAPTTSAAIVRIVGYGEDGNSLFFCPDNNYMELF